MATNTLQVAITDGWAAAIEAKLHGFKAPGGVVYVKTRDGTFLQPFGYSHYPYGAPISPVEPERITVDHHFRIGSNTKSMTGTVILQLIEDASIDINIDDVITKHLNSTDLGGLVIPNGDLITIDMMLSMRSGLNNYSNTVALNRTLDTDAAHVWTPLELLKLAFVPDLDDPKKESSFAPGASYEYSNTNTVLLGMVIEKLCGASLQTVFQQRIISRQGQVELKNTVLPANDDANMPTPYPPGYQFSTNVATIPPKKIPDEELKRIYANEERPTEVTNENPSWAWSAGGVISTITDLAHYAEELVTGGYLTAEIQKKRLASIRETVAGNPHAPWYGWNIVKFHDQMFGHTGEIPGYQSFMGHDGERGITAIVWTNLNQSPIGEACATSIYRGIIYPSLYPSVTTAAPVAEAVAVAAIAAVVAAPILELPSSSSPAVVPVVEPVPVPSPAEEFQAVITPPAAIVVEETAVITPPVSSSPPSPSSVLLPRQNISQRAVHTAATATTPAVLLDDFLAAEEEKKKKIAAQQAVVVTPAAAVVLEEKKTAATAVPVSTLSLATTDNWIANITTKLAELKTPGGVVYVQTPDGTFMQPFGHSSTGTASPHDLMTVNHHFRIGSNTKTMTGTVILQLIEQGRLALDDVITKHLPSPSVPIINGDTITIQHLLEMRSGLYNYGNTVHLNTLLDTKPDHVWTNDELLRQAFITDATNGNKAPTFAPGEGFEPSNTNTLILGMIIEAIEGAPLADVFQRRLFTPLGLSHTSLPAADSTVLPSPYASGYQFSTNVKTIPPAKLPADELLAINQGTLLPSDVTATNASSVLSVSGVISTATDLATYVRHLIGVDDEKKASYLTTDLQAKRLASFKSTDPQGRPSTLMYGWHLTRFHDTMYGHTGVIPGYQSFMGYDASRGNTVVICCNLTISPTGIQPAVALYRAVIQPSLYPKTKGMASPSIAMYAITPLSTPTTTTATVTPATSTAPAAAATITTTTTTTAAATPATTAAASTTTATSGDGDNAVNKKKIVESTSTTHSNDTPEVDRVSASCCIIS